MKASPDVTDHPARILIVDDERQNRQLLEAMLKPEGYVLLTAGSGEEALSAVALESPDLLLLDVMMPGMDGYQVAGRIKSDAATRSIPIIMITALDDREARMNGLSAGAEDFLTKPVGRGELCMRVRNLLRLKAYGDYHDKYSRRLEEEVGERAAELVESERVYRETFDEAPVGIVHVGPDGRWLRVNQRVCDLLGYTRAELQGIDPRELAPPEPVTGEAESLRLMTEGKLDRHVLDEKAFRGRDGRVVWARVNTSVHRDAQGLPRFFISVIEDITERRALEAQIRQASKMDGIGRLAAGVAHDFNNLLTVILGFAELINTDVARANQHSQELNEIVKAAQRASGLTHQLLAFSRQQVLRAAPLDLNALITDMTGMLGRLIGGNVDISLALSPDVGPALADRSQLEQVVMNLVVNARDAMPGGGTVTIQTADIVLEASAFHDEPVVPGRYVMLAITDTGTGMSKETQRRIFEPFFTTKELGKGTGLGLSTTYGIVKQSKGHIWVESQPGLGTTFTVYLPCATPGPAASSITPPMQKAVQTVLLVESDDLLRISTKGILESAGYLVLEAGNGLDAESSCVRHAGSIDLALMDVVMPDCGGPELAGRLEARGTAPHVLYLSDDDGRAALSGAGIDQGLPVLQKPFTAAKLLSRVREALGR